MALASNYGTPHSCTLRQSRYIPLAKRVPLKEGVFGEYLVFVDTECHCIAIAEWPWSRIDGAHLGFVLLILS